MGKLPSSKTGCSTWNWNLLQWQLPLYRFIVGFSGHGGIAVLMAAATFDMMGVLVVDVYNERVIYTHPCWI